MAARKKPDPGTPEGSVWIRTALGEYNVDPGSEAFLRLAEQGGEEIPAPGGKSAGAVQVPEAGAIEEIDADGES